MVIYGINLMHYGKPHFCLSEITDSEWAWCIFISKETIRFRYRFFVRRTVPSTLTVYGIRNRI